jgi:superfamily II DNA or RNA helicase
LKVEATPQITPGARVRHPDFGEGVVIGLVSGGFVRCFFTTGERQVPASSLSRVLDRTESIIRNAHGRPERNRKAWLSFLAHKLPLLDSAASLTSAKIDLLPHQVVLVHRIAVAAPRRFLIADEVGLGKTIETALVLRELASRGEMARALMVVPAGLVNNWHQELNEVFNLNFEVFGREGDVTDRRSNAFAKHNLLIGSIDTLKQKSRLKNLEEAPDWDLIVFDEAHHLTAYKSGGKVKKTLNYKLGELLKRKSRDLLLLSATPHQGDHFRFWMLVQLLDPTLFQGANEMVEKRHRLNAVVFRRTKADACRPDGSPLFARRWVHTESFLMSGEESTFYNRLTEYLAEGFALAKRQGQKGTALGFVMTIFQKIAASSFAAVGRTLRRRLIALTVHEGLVFDDKHEVEKRNRAWLEARQLIREEFGLSEDQMGEAENDRILSDIKRKLLKKLKQEELALASDEYTSEATIAASEDTAVNSVEVALPEERLMIRHVLEAFPKDIETKVQKLMGAMKVLWEATPDERMVIFATYLGSVEMLGKCIEHYFPDKGVTVLRGGDHQSKVAAEKRFKAPDGPRVIICTAAGREGINLQHARILFNFDLPFNPMDLEQRIGRIHRYGQKNTAQVYNLVLSDTIEGSIFLMLEDKLQAIADTLGKVDDQGNVAEDLRSQILGQLSEGINYQKLYAEALQDPKLQRTEVELQAAMQNASDAREAVFELFQDLDGFSLDEYEPLSDTAKDVEVVSEFVRGVAGQDGLVPVALAPGDFRLDNDKGETQLAFTPDREKAQDSKFLELLGLDHPYVVNHMQSMWNLPPDEIGIRVQSRDGRQGYLAVWKVETEGERRQRKVRLLIIGVSQDGERIPSWERKPAEIFNSPPSQGQATGSFEAFKSVVEPTFERELKHRGIVSEGMSYQADLVGWVEVA